MRRSSIRGFLLMDGVDGYLTRCGAPNLKGSSRFDSLYVIDGNRINRASRTCRRLNDGRERCRILSQRMAS